MTETAEGTMIETAEGTMTETAEGTMIETAEVMTEIDIMTAEVMTIIVKAMTNRGPMSESL